MSYGDETGVVHKRTYAYHWNHLLAKVNFYENNQLKSELRIVRSGFLPIQDRDSSNALLRDYVWGLSKGGGIGGLLSMSTQEQDYYYHYDGRGNVTFITDTNQNRVAEYTYADYGSINNQAGTLAQPFRFSTKRYDEDTGLIYFGYRYYAPATFKWLTRDPIAEAGGVNLYGYVSGNPLKYIDPFGLDSLVANNGTLTHYNNSGNVVGTYPYTTGQDGVTDPSTPWQGPIPPGNYSLDPSQISEGGFLRNLLGDWGKYRLPLTPDSSTNTYGRDGFFLHGGKKPGSAGCIDVGSFDKTLFPNLMVHDGPIPVTVK